MQRTLALGLLALTAGASQAQSAIGDFTTWTAHGDVLLFQTSTAMTTAFNAGGEEPFNMSGNPTVFIDEVEQAAGLPFHALDLGDEPAYEGSVVNRSITVAAGDTLSFQWRYVTLDVVFQDPAFVAIGGQLFTLATLSTAPSAPQTFSHTFASAGTFTLALGVVDTGDFVGDTELLVDNLQLAAVPEPATWALWLGGAAALGVLRRRRAHSAER